MVYLDFRSLCLINAMQRVGRGSGRRLVPYSRRFTLSVTGGCLAALAPREGAIWERPGERRLETAQTSVELWRDSQPWQNRI